MDLEKEVLKFKSGDEKAFDVIYENTVSLVRFAIYSVIPNKNIIEDLIQDVYTKVSNQIQLYSSNNFTSWIYRIARNLAIDYVKKKKEFFTDDVDYLENTKSSHPYLYYAIRHLEDVEREVFLMKVLCGHTTKKISKILDIEITKVNQIYYRAKEKLKASLEASEDEITTI